MGDESHVRSMTRSHNAEVITADQDYEEKQGCTGPVHTVVCSKFDADTSWRSYCLAISQGIGVAKLHYTILHANMRHAIDGFIKW